ncbi:MAG: hypothetical protein IKY98_03870, partial [Alphaproteobacteria bacterium]|nr:hypothetical protein [Alphaproteobacteria bacterium]
EKQPLLKDKQPLLKLKTTFIEMFPGVCLALWLRVRAGLRLANRRWRNPTPALSDALGGPVAGISSRQVSSTLSGQKNRPALCGNAPGKNRPFTLAVCFPVFLVFSRFF